MSSDKDNQVYVVYDQFHWQTPDHVEYVFKGWDVALANYAFLKDAHPDKSLGLCTKEEFIKKLKTITNSEAKWSEAQDSQDWQSVARHC